MEFHYYELSENGKKIRSTLDAPTLEEAKKKLKSQGIVYSSLSPSRGGWGFLIRRSAMPVSRLSGFSRDLAVYLNAGIPLPRALLMMKRQNPSGSREERFFEALIDAIHEGKSFAQALETQRHYLLPAYYTGTLKISEDRGILSDVLSELSEYLEIQEKIRKQIAQALIYPGFIIVAAIGMISFMLSVVVPKITTVFETTGQALPALTETVITAAAFSSRYWWVIALGTVMFLVAFSARMRGDYRFRRFIHRFILSLPVIGDLIMSADLARFSTISSMLMRSGIPAVQTFRLASVTLSSEVLRELFDYVSARVVEGSSLSKALTQYDRFRIDPSFVEAVAIGEETSELPSMLGHLGKLYQETNRDKIAVFLALLEPTLMLLIGGAVGVIVTAMLLPIFSLSFE